MIPKKCLILCLKFTYIYLSSVRDSDQKDSKSLSNKGVLGPKHTFGDLFGLVSASLVR